MAAKDDTTNHIGVNQSRRCRDVPFIVLFVLYWAGMFIVAQAAVAGSDISQIFTPKDYLGNYCGKNNTDLNSTLLTAKGIPASYRDQTANPYLYYLNPLNFSSPAICIPICPNFTQIITDVSTEKCSYGIVSVDLVALAANVNDGLCAPYLYSSRSIKKRCVPNEPIPASFFANQTVLVAGVKVSTASMYDSLDSTTITVASEIYTSWPLLAIAAGATIVLTYIWIIVLRVMGGFFVWFTVISSNIICMGVTVLLGLYWQNQIALQNSRSSGQFTSTLANGTVISFSGYSANLNVTSYIPIDTSAVLDQTEIRTVFITFIVFIVLSVILLLVSIAIRKHLKLATAIIKETSITFVILPFAAALSIAGIALYLIVILIFLLAPRDPAVLTIVGRSWSNPNINTYMIWFHLAGSIWAFQFVLGFLTITVSGAVATYYWRLNKDERVGILPVLQSMYRVIRYHLGSVAIGALLVTIVEMIRITLYQLQKNIADSKVPYLKYLVACVQCCMKCLEMIIRWINHNAYIYIAITGKAFFKSAGAATSLLLRNAVKLTAMNFVSGLCLLLSKLIITGAISIASYFVLIKFSVHFPDIRFPFLIVSMVAFEAFLLSSVLLSMYDTGIDTNFLCVLQDLEMNDGTPQRPYYMSEGIKSIVSKHNEIMNANAKAAASTPLNAGQRV